MKTKFISIIVIATAMLSAFPVDAGSIGRSGGSSSSSSSRSSYSAPSRPSPSYSAPAPSRPSAAPGGIGGTSGSMGVRKSEVTAPVAAKVQATRPAPATTPSPNTTPGYSNPAPSYGVAPAPSYQPTGSPFLSSMGGAFAGSVLGNMMFSGNRAGGTVVNTGGSSGGATGSYAGPNGAPVAYQKSYGLGDAIMDIILFVILIAVIVGAGFLFYKGYQKMRSFINTERGGSNQPLAPTQAFWDIQKAFAAADAAELSTVLGPDMVEATMNLTPSTLTLSNVSHEVVLNKPREFSVHYTFTDDGSEVNQVWHFEKFGSDWKLNGIETV